MYAGGKNASVRQRQTCESGTHPGFAGSHLDANGSHPCQYCFLLERLKDSPCTMDKRSLTERDICTKFILPAVKRAGWDEMLQVREEVYFTKGRIIVRGKLVTRGKAKKADFVLCYKPNIPIALIEAKDNNHSVGHGIQQGLDYAATLDIPFVFASNGDGFVFHDRTGQSVPIETNLGLDAFPSPADLWARYRAWKGLDAEAEQIVLQDYFDDGSGKAPRYYQVNAVNAAIEAIAKGCDRVLLVMATGTGKTYRRRSQRAATACCLSWRPARARPTPRFRSFGVCGRRAARSASYSSPTATC
jgi:Type I restriction enzyme R protein N terminus (HSDR_N)/Type III restriction enzyme, res subunit